jgi:hypothetical protein
MLTQLCLHYSEGAIHCVPYHGGGVHRVEAANHAAVLLRPARVNRRYWAVLARSLADLEEALNNPSIHERDIERVLVDNPLRLRSLGFREVYHQVVLPREGRRDLIPDVIAEPVDSDFAEILELKLPDADVVVGTQDRARLSRQVNEAAAQLREYSAYFDDRAAAEPIERELGIPCYKPRLTVAIGRNPTRFTPEEQRRALTAHPDLRVVTYDRLMDAAQRRLLL